MSKPKHHIREEICTTRPPYREGRKPTAVKVYTIHHESKYILIQGVPAVGAREQLVRLFEAHGEIEKHRALDDYPAQQFTEVYLIKYKRIQSARFAKKKLDDWSFYGGVLHVCYAPEYETVQETREKIIERRRVVASKARQYANDGTYSGMLSRTVGQHQEGSRSHLKQKASESLPETSEGEIINSTELRKANSQTHVQIPDCGIPGRGVMTQTGSEVVHSALCANFYGESSSLLEQGTPSTVTLPQYGGQSVPPSLVLPVHSQNDHHAVFKYGNQYMPSDFSLPNLASSAENETYACQGHNMNNRDQLHGTRTIEPKLRKNYGQEVVQQAQSLQHYGHMLNDDEKAAGSGTGLKRLHNSEVNPEKSEEESVTETESRSSEEQLILPPPPKQIKSSSYVFKNTQKRERRKVPSAHATLSQDFDARTGKNLKQLKPEVVSPESGNVPRDVQRFPRVIEWDKKPVEQNSEKTMQEKIEENLKSSSPVIKAFNKTTVPRFIPRQAQIKTKSETAEKIKPSVEKDDHLSKEIRKNALTLGKPQGPADLGTSVSNEKLDPKEKSVIDSIQQIRKKLTKV